MPPGSLHAACFLCIWFYHHFPTIHASPAVTGKKCREQNWIRSFDQFLTEAKLSADVTPENLPLNQIWFQNHRFLQIWDQSIDESANHWCWLKLVTCYQPITYRMAFSDGNMELTVLCGLFGFCKPWKNSYWVGSCASLAFKTSSQESFSCEIRFSYSSYDK